MKLYQSPVPNPSSEFVLSVSRLVSKGATMGAAQDKKTIKKNGVSMILDARKCQKKYDVILEGK